MAFPGAHCRICANPRWSREFRAAPTPSTPRGLGGQVRGGPCSASDRPKGGGQGESLSPVGAVGTHPGCLASVSASVKWE